MVTSFIALFFVFKCSDDLYPLPERGIFKNCIVSITEQLICEAHMISPYLPSLWLIMTNLSEILSSLLLLGRWLSASVISEGYVVPESTERTQLQKHQTYGQGGRRRVTGVWRVSSAAQDAMLVAEFQRNPFISLRELEPATCFHG
jgi:hypothetical protein